MKICLTSFQITCVERSPRSIPYLLNLQKYKTFWLFLLYTRCFKKIPMTCEKVSKKNCIFLPWKKIVPPNAMLYSFAKKKLDLKKKWKNWEKKKFLLLENTERFFDINTYIRLYPAIFYCKPKSITRQLIFGLTKKKLSPVVKHKKIESLHTFLCF